MFGFKIIKEKDLRALGEQVADLQSIVCCNMVVIDTDGKTTQDSRDSAYINKIWNKYWDLDGVINKSFKKLRG